MLVDVFPQPFEGCKLAINKGLSNHFQVNHTLQLSGMGPGAYHFGATYVGNKQTGPNEVHVVFYMYFHIVLRAAINPLSPNLVSNINFLLTIIHKL